MANRFATLSLRDFFWLILLSAIAVGWYLERTRALKQITEYKAKQPFEPNPVGPTDGSIARNKLLGELAALNEKELVKRFGQIKAPTPYGAADDYACCLTEMVRRKMHAELQTHYDQLMTNKGQGFDGPANALLLTALRRAQGKPDPLQIDVELVSGEGESLDDSHPEQDIPGIKPVLKNIDEQPIFITRGGDYRSGRQTRWRVHLTNEKGVRIADSNFPIYGIGGGISSFGALEPGELSDNYSHLDARSYVRSPPSGNYQLQVVYSEQEIAAEPDLSGLVVWTSQPIEVEVTNRTIAKEQQFSVVPLVSILAIGGVVLAISALRQWTHVSNAGARSPWNQLWRDILAAFLLVALTAGWVISTRALFAEIERLRPDREADWSMKMIDEST